MCNHKIPQNNRGLLEYVYCCLSMLAISLRTNNRCSRRNVQARYAQKCVQVISTKLFYRASVPRVTTDYTVKARSNFFAPIWKKKGNRRCGNTNSAVRHGMLNCTHSNDWIDAANLRNHWTSRKKQIFCTYLRKNYIGVQSY